MALINSMLTRTKVAYLSMEIAIRPEMHTYSGGLGILAGDTARSAADLQLPVVFVTLVMRGGYLKQTIDPTGWQVDAPDPWDPSDWATPLDAMVAVRIEGRPVWIRPWLHVLQSPLGGRIPVILLDTNIDQNDAGDRTITDMLYGGDSAYRLKQEIVLGIGGMRILEALGFGISVYHLNEGHAALLGLPLIARLQRSNRNGQQSFDLDRVRERCVFTTHTPVEAGHDKFDYGLVSHLFGDSVDIGQLREIAGHDGLNMTKLAMNVSGYVNGVARRHAETTKRMFPGYEISAVTNGVHVPTWAHPSFARLFQSVTTHWGHEPELLVNADQLLRDDHVWGAHMQAKGELIELVAERTGVRFDPEVATIGFARRMTGYKRPALLFQDLDRLVAINKGRPFQLVMAGKAHPRDNTGKETIRDIHAKIESLKADIRMAFLPGYDMAMAKTLVPGVDIWLNTPLPPLEASGTSGMKAALNGVLNLSTLDGWWEEGYLEGATGWSIGDPAHGDSHAHALYSLLEETVLPLYYDDRPKWIWMMKQAIAKITPYFNTQRMMRRYATEAYFR